MKSEELFERSKRVSPGGVHSPVRAFRGVGGTPRFMQSAKGAYLEDVEGKKYLDFCLSWGPLILGHQDPEVADAVKSALSRGWSYGTTEPYSLELAEFITSRIPWVQKVRFVNSGTEAVMSALRVGRAATGRSKVLKFDGCYHGHLDSLLVRAGSGLADMASPDSAGVSAAVAAETIVAPLNDLKALREIFAQHGKEIAVTAFEPIPANNGLLPQTEEFIREIFKLAKDYGSLVLFDEVITGFRVGMGGMAERMGLRPDLVTYGKIIGGGFPVGAYGGRADLLDLVAPAGPVYQAGTLSANPIAMTAGIATLKKLDRDKPFKKLEDQIGKLARQMESIAKETLDYPVRVQNESSMMWSVLGESKGIVRSHTDAPPQQKERYAKLFHALLDRGVYFAPSGFEVCFLSTAHTDSDLNKFLEIFREACRAK